MAFAYVLDPCLQHQNRAGVNNVHGYFKVYLAGTDDLAETYSDFGGSLNPENIEIDNNGRCVIIADSSHPYRVEMYLPNGDLVYTQEPVWTLSSGGGASIIDIESTDASVQIDKTAVGGKVTYDLSVSEDDPNRLDWIKCIGAQLVDGIYVPQKSAGTLDMGEKGISLGAEMYYHATVRVKATKNQQRLPYYDEVTVVLGLWDGETTTTIGTCKRIVDYSLGLSQEFEVGADIKVGNLNSQLVISITGQDHQGGDFEIPEVDLHRIYSGVPRLPAGVATRAWVNENFQKKLVAGANITINALTNEISATIPEQEQSDWNEADSSKPDYIKNKPNLATVATSGSYDDLSNKPTIPDPQVQSDWAESDNRRPDYIKNKPTLASVATSGDYNDLSNRPSIPAAQEQSDWNEADPSKVDYIKNKPNLASVATSGSYNDLSDKPTIPPGVVVDQHYDPTSEDAQSGIAVKEALDAYQALPASTAQDAGKVLRVDTDGNPEWAAGGAQQVQSDWAQTDSSAVDFIKNKPNLAAVATSGSYNDLSDKPSIPAAQVQSDWDQSDNQAVDFIKNKPDLSGFATKTEVTQGLAGKQDVISDLATIRSGATEGATAVQPGDLAAVATSGSYNDLSDKPSIPAAQVNADWNASSGVAEILNKPQNLVQDANYVHTDNNFTTAEKDKLAGIQADAEQNVQSDWNQSDSSADDFIKNKPAIPVIPQMKDLVAGSNVTITEGANAVTISASGSPQQQADWAQTDSAAVDYIKNKPAIPTVDQTYDAASANAQSGVAVAQAIGSVPTVPSSTSADAGKVLTVDSNGDPEWDTVQAGGGTRLATGEGSGLWAYPDGSAAGVSVSKFSNRLSVFGSDYGYYNYFTPQASNTLISVYDPAAYIGYRGKFSLTFGWPSSSATVIPSGYKAAWCPDTGKTRYYIVESGATLPARSSFGGTTITYLDRNTSVTYPAYGNCQIPMPPSVRPDYTPDATRYTKVGDWSSLTSDIRQWYLGFVNPSTGVWLTVPTEYVNGTAYVRGGAQNRYGLRVPSELPYVTSSNDGCVLKVVSGAWARGTVNEVPASTTGDTGKVLTVDSAGAAGWATPAVDQTYDATSTGAQSGVAVAGALGGKEDTFDAGLGLQFTTDGQGNRVLQVDETVIWVVPSGSENSNNYSITLSETIHNFEEIAVYCKCTRVAGTLQVMTKNVYPVCDPGYTMFADGVSTNHWNIADGQNGHYTCGVDVRLTGATGYIGENYRWGMADGSTAFEGSRASNSDIYPHPYKIVGLKRIANN